jgi:hypothetical protein
VVSAAACTRGIHSAGNLPRDQTEVDEFYCPAAVETGSPQQGYWASREGVLGIRVTVGGFLESIGITWENGIG